MCGIAGFLDYHKNYKKEEPYYQNILEQMRQSLKHRGDDQSGTFLLEHVGLSHARLSIRDIEGGTQPMVRQKNGRTYAICYNGEIYNADELASELTSAGYIRYTASDTEVILYAYMHYGPNFVSKLNGIFAFAIWDGARDALYLYRDRVGVKPLFYTFTNTNANHSDHYTASMSASGSYSINSGSIDFSSTDCCSTSSSHADCSSRNCASTDFSSTGGSFISYSSEYTGSLVFASEPKGLFAHPAVTPQLNLESLQQVLGIGPARTMGCGVFKDVHEVLPGHYLTCSRNGVRDNTWWDLESRPHEDDYAATVEKTSFLVCDAVRRQMVSDVPVCTFLSGGIDSSIVTALASQYLEEHGEKLNTFSFDFTGNDRYFRANSFQPEQDRPYVDIMLSHYPTNHTYLFCDEQQLLQSLDTAVDAKDLPGMADVDASMLYFCGLVKKQNKVALTGECADEIFGGYPWFYRKSMLEADGFPWSSDISARTLLLKDDWTRRLDLADYSHEQYLTSLAQAPMLSGETPEQARRRGVAYLNIKWFMQTLLDRMDRTSMYWGLEARVPFADHRIIEYVFNVPWEMKYRDQTEKALLRDATRDLLPPELLHRKKSPYPKTYHPMYEKLLADRLTAILKDPNAPIRPLIDMKKAAAFLQSPKEYGRPWFGQLMASPQLMAYYIQLNTWMENYNLSLP